MIHRRRLVALTPGALGLAALAGRPARAASSPAEPATYVIVALTDPVEGQEAAYERWFAEAHLGEMARVPGMVAVERYTDARFELRRAATKTPRDLILYTVQTDRPDEAKAAMAGRAEAGGAWPGPALASVRGATYRATQPRLPGAGGEPADAQAGNAATYLVLAFLDAVAGQDDALNTWYDTVHEPELLANRGVTSGQRATLSEVQMGPGGIQSRYLMQMSIVTSDLAAVFREILAGGPPPPSLDRTRGFGYTYRAVAL